MKNYTKIKIENPELLFFTSDPHFFHERIIEHCARPWKDAQEMGDALIRNRNAVVPKNGEVFFLATCSGKGATWKSASGPWMSVLTPTITCRCLGAM